MISVNETNNLFVIFQALNGKDLHSSRKEGEDWICFHVLLFPATITQIQNRPFFAIDWLIIVPCEVMNPIASTKIENNVENVLSIIIDQLQIRDGMAPTRHIKAQ